MRSQRQIRKVKARNCAAQPSRAGVSTLDYILVIGIILPLVAFAVPAGKRIIQLTYEMVCTLVAWPMM